MTGKPTIYLSNWSSHKTPGHHGDGLKLTIMARPRAWENGDGVVASFMPPVSLLNEVRDGRISFKKYAQELRELWDLQRRVYEDSTRLGGKLGPGELAYWRDHGKNTLPQVVPPDSTLCCACARGRQCHRRIAAEFLHAAGWRVVLDGEEYAP